MNFVFIPSPIPGNRTAREWRGYQLAAAIHNTHHSTASIVPIGKIIKPTFKEKVLLQRADALIIEADPDPSFLSAIQHLKMLNKTVFLDLAIKNGLVDSGQSLESSTGTPGVIDRSIIKINETIQWQMRLADIVVSPSPRLLEDIRCLACGLLIPEYVELDRYHNLGKMVHSGVVLGWNNASSDPDAGMHSGLQTALEHICRARPFVRVEIFGGNPAILDSIEIQSGSVCLLPGPADKSWPAALSCVDIGLAPLNSDLDQRRGWMDVLEFMAMKIPWIASQGSAYYDLREYGWVVENNASTWERVLLDMIDHLSAYSEEAQGDPYLFAISQGIDENIESILGRFAKTIEQQRRVKPV